MANKAVEFVRFRETHEVMRQRPDPMVGGLVYETLSLVCAEFQIASVCGSSHQSNVLKRGKVGRFLLQVTGHRSQVTGHRSLFYQYRKYPKHL